MNALTLPEHLILLALQDEEGSVVQSGAVALPYGLNGALLLELSLRKRVKVEEGILIEVSDATTGDDILDDALKALADCERDKTAEFWVARPDALVKDLKERLLDRLVNSGILRREEHRFLWLLPVDHYPAADGEPERDLRKRVNDVVLRDGAADESTALLIGLIHACGLVKEVFPGEDFDAVTAKLKTFSEGSQIANAVSEDVAAATTAVVCTTVMASIIAKLDR
jgi:golgi phosphoprotein 3